MSSRSLYVLIMQLHRAAEPGPVPGAGIVWTPDNKTPSHMLFDSPSNSVTLFDSDPKKLLWTLRMNPRLKFHGKFLEILNNEMTSNYIWFYILSLFISFCQISLQTSPIESCHHLLGECRGSEVVVAPWRSPSRAQPVCGSSTPKKGCLTRVDPIVYQTDCEIRTGSQMKSLLIFKVSMWNSFWKNDSKKSSNLLHLSSCSSSNSVIFIQAAKDPRIAEDVEKLPSMSMDAKRPRLEQSLPFHGKNPGGWWIDLSYDFMEYLMYFSSDT